MHGRVSITKLLTIEAVLLRSMQWQGKFKAGLRGGEGQQSVLGGRQHNCVTKRPTRRRRRRRRGGESTKLTFSSLKLKQGAQYKNRVRKRWFCGEGRTSPTLMVFRPIKVVYSYDVIRGGHRLFRFVRR